MPARPLLVVGAVLLLVIGGLVGWRLLGQEDENPFAERMLFVAEDDLLVAASRQAGADGDAARSDRLARLATVPTGTWLTPEQFPTPEDVAARATAVVGAATDADAVALLVVYGIPDRDCTGGQSSGGLPADEYGPWVQAVADVTAGPHAVVVLEPDALVSADQCGLGDGRLDQLADAVDALAEAGVATYVDAGHSAWRDADEVADLLARVGVDEVRGFSVNVANYQPLGTETAWAERLSAAVDDAPYVLDTGRNGANAGRVDEWCNPANQALGSEPGLVDDGTALDALLWVKPPWESDGSCNGGPPAGQLWVDRADELAANAGW